MRQKTIEFKAKIAEACAAINTQIQEIKEEVQASPDIDKNEELYAQIDTLEEEAYTITEKTLDEILPEAFAVMKETARRFVNNATLKVTALEYDRILSGTTDYVTLQDDQAIWSNSWDAAGKEVTWDMVHYDVQLIGGIALAQGKNSRDADRGGKNPCCHPAHVPQCAGRERMPPGNRERLPCQKG